LYDWRFEISYTSYSQTADSRQRVGRGGAGRASWALPSMT
jgi:hypothetical protein